jgi:hypothetical protein
MRAAGFSNEEIDVVATHRFCQGERPSNTILFRRHDPFSLGQLIALYEHKAAVQGCLWGIDSFDQWGLEPGEQMARGNPAVADAERRPPARSRHRRPRRALQSATRGDVISDTRLTSSRHAPSDGAEYKPPILSKS